VIIAPVIIHAPPATVESPPPAPVVVTAAPVAATVPAPAAATTPAPVATTPSPTTEPVAKPAEAAPAPAAEGSLADRIATFVDKVRVMGIRTTDSGSKVLMNDHVYRLNDVVDRKLGLRLVKIEADSLTFADATGATYVKTF